MPFNGNGVFNRVYNWQNDANAGIPITASRVDTEDNGFATGLTNCITKDGQTTITANLPMATFRHLNVGNAQQRNEYLTLGQFQDGAVIWGGTAGGTANAITISLSPIITAYVAGMRVAFIASADNTGAVTLSVNGVTAADLTKDGVDALEAGDILQDAVVEAVYDGAQFQITNIAYTNFKLRQYVDGKTSDYTVVLADNNKYFPIDASGGEVTLTLPAEATAGDGYFIEIQKVDSSENAVVIEDDAASELFRINFEGDSLKLIGDSTDWYILNRPDNLSTVNSQTGTTYTVVSSDNQKLITLSNASPVAVTLPEADTAGFPDGWKAAFKNIGSDTVTITPTTSTIDGGSDLDLEPGEWATIRSVGGNYVSTKYSIYVAPRRIWAVTSGGSSPSIVGGNGLTVSRPAISRYKFTFDTAQANTNYAVLVTTVSDGDRISCLRTTNKTTTDFEVITVNASFAGADPTGGVCVEVIPSDG